MALLLSLVFGLAPGPAGVAQFLERVAASTAPEALRALLAELGAEALLERP